MDTENVNIISYDKEIYTISPVETPFLALIGGAQGEKALKTTAPTFPTCSLYQYPNAAQPDISESESLTAPANSYDFGGGTNVTQIFQERISVAYDRVLTAGRLPNISAESDVATLESEMDFQVTRTLEKMARDIEFTFLNGVYANPGTTTDARKTRGMLATAATSAGGTTHDATGETFSKTVIDEALNDAYTNQKAEFRDFYFFVNGTTKQLLSTIYENQYNYHNLIVPNELGINITPIETDFGVIKVVLDKFVPANTIIGADLSVIRPVEQLVPQKGNFFLEELSRTGASQEYQIFGEIGLDHGPSFMHLAITNIGVSGS